MNTPESDQADDTLRTFTAALPAAARHHLELDYRTIRHIRAATEHHTPAELARIVGSGIGWHTPHNAAALIRFRLQREARDYDDNPNDPLPEERPF